MTNLQPIYVCDTCFKLDMDYNDGLCHIFNEKTDSDCPGQLRAAFYADEIVKAIKNKMKENELLIAKAALMDFAETIQQSIGHEVKDEA